MLRTVHGNKALTHMCVSSIGLKNSKKDTMTMKMIQRVDIVINCSKSINSRKILWTGGYRSSSNPKLMEDLDNLHSDKHFIISWFQTFTMFWMLYAFFWVIPQRLNFICWRFRTLCPFHLHRQVGVEFCTYAPMKMEQTECSEMSAYKIRTPGNYPEESIQNFIIQCSDYVMR